MYTTSKTVSLSIAWLIIWLIIDSDKVIADNTNSTSPIYDSKLAKLGEFPYHVHLTVVVFPYTLTANCGGTLVSDSYVLTAAQCLYRKKVEKFEDGTFQQHDDQYAWVWEANVHFGVTKQMDPKGLIEQKDMYVPAINFEIHPEFDPTEVRNDIALIKLPEKVHFNDFIKAINLPKRSMTNLSNNRVIHVGWGIVDSDKKTRPFDLRYAFFETMYHERCNQLLMYYRTIMENMHICVISGSSRQQSCGGDLGNALILKEYDGTLTQVGVLSFVANCGKDRPSVFTRVSNYLDWISERTGIVIRD